jgi:hypothetical protein
MPKKKVVENVESDILIERDNENLEDRDEREEIVERDDNESIEAPKVKPKRKLNLSETELQRRKDQLAQIHIRKRAKKIEADKQKEIEKEILKKQTEEKIVKKAVAIKKKQIIKEAILEDSDDDDIPIEIVKKIKAKQVAKKEPKVDNKPQFYFV